jgi:hypothetical protein
MNKIFKYPLPVKEKYTLLLPKDARIIRVDDVEGLFYLWAIVDSSDDGYYHEMEERFLEFYKTGQPIETPLEDLNYIGFCKIFIMQELCLYVLENISK